MYKIHSILCRLDSEDSWISLLVSWILSTDLLRYCQKHWSASLDWLLSSSFLSQPCWIWILRIACTCYARLGRGRGPTCRDLVGVLARSIAILPAAVSKGELSTAMPSSGGSYVYIERTYGPLMGTVTGIGLWGASMLKKHSH